MSKLLIIMFFLGILGVYVFAHYLIFKDIILIFSVESIKLKIFIGIFIAFSGLSFFIYELSLKFFRLGFLQYYSSVWMGFITLSFVFFILIWVWDLIGLPYDRVFGFFTLFLVLILMIISVKNGLKLPEVKKIEIVYKDLPPALDGYKIVHLSDLHLGSVKARGWSKKLVKIVDSLNPDLILITGDLIDRGAGHIREDFYELKRLKAKDGIYAITGNHEFYSNYNLFLRLTDETKINKISNNCVKINDNLEVLGMDDPELRAFLKNDVKLEDIIKNCSDNGFKIFLYHRPEKFEKAVNLGINLQLSGHTHNGQIFPINFIVSAVYKYHYGLFKFKNSYIYTTSGVSTWGPPMRLFSENELPLIVLRRGG